MVDVNQVTKPKGICCYGHGVGMLKLLIDWLIIMGLFDSLSHDSLVKLNFLV